MTSEQFEREKNYRMAIVLAKIMLRDGLIEEDEYRAIEPMLAEEFRPVFGAL